MTKRKTIYIMFAVLFIALFALVLSYSEYNPLEEEAVYADSKPVVSLSGGGAPSNGKCSVYINLSKVCDEDVNVRIKTFDWSGIASQEDYEEKDTTVIISSGITKSQVTIAVYDKSIFRVSENGTNYLRQFIVKIVSASDNVTIASDKREVYCDCSYSHTYIAKKSSSYATKYFEAYESTKDYSIESHEMGGFWSSAESHSWDKDIKLYSDKSSWWDDYAAIGLANIYFTANGKVHSGDSLQWDGGVDFKFDGSYIYEAEVDGWWSNEKVNYAYLYKRGGYDGWNGEVEFGGDTSYPTINGYNNYDAKKTYYTFNKDEQWAKLDSKPEKITMHYYINGGYWRKEYDWVAKFRLADIKPPSIKGWYVDSTVLEGNDTKIYLRVRFDEPVQVYGTGTNLPKVKCAYNGIGVSNLATFNYVGGSNTDTLVFCYDVADKTSSYGNKVTSFKPVYIENASYIADFGYAGTVNGTLLNCGENDVFTWGASSGTKKTSHIDIDSQYTTGLGMPCEFDPRTPTIDEPTLPTQVQKAVSIDVTINQMDGSGTVLYEWSTEKSAANVKLTQSGLLKSSTGSESRFSVSAANITGEHYLYIQAISKYRKESAVRKFGPVKFDNSPYEVSYFDSFNSDGNANEQDLEKSGFPYQQAKKRTIQFEVVENYPTCDSGIYQISVLWSKSSIWNSDAQFLRQKDVYDYNKGVIGATVGDPVMQSNGTSKRLISVELTADNTFGIPDGYFDKFYIGFIVKDNLDNVMSMENVKPIAYEYYFDTREMYDSETTVSGTPLVEIDSIGVYDCTKTNPIITTKFTKAPNSVAEILVNKPIANVDGSNYYYEPTEDESYNPSKVYFRQSGDSYEIAYISEFIPGQVYYEKKQHYTYADWFNASYAEKNPSEVKLSIKNGAIDIGGYYEISIKVETVDGFKYTYDFPIYLTNGMTEKTTNSKLISSGEVLNNKVYMVSNTKYFYKDSVGDIQSFNYGGDYSDIIFSSYEEAYKYFTFMERQDMQILEIQNNTDGETIASQINANTNANYRKATGETTTAKVGQVWIRYKRTGWQGAANAASDWGYYYYSSGINTINPNLFSLTLSNAINEIVTSILATYGYDTYLTDANGYLDVNGCPRVREGQIHPDTVTVATTLSGSNFTSQIQYEGDANIYSPYIKYENEDLILASSFPWTFSNYGKSFVLVGNEYRRISQDNGTNLNHQVQNTGKYKIREIDEYGVSEYFVFIDREAASITATGYTIDQMDGYNVNFSDRRNGIEYDFKGRGFTINSMLLEYDKLSYMNLYKMANNEFIQTITYNDIIEYGKKGGFKLENGRYYFYVYDRSGNNYRINVTINDTDLMPVIKESPNVSLTIDISSNRTSDDIDEFIVYLDGVAIDKTKETTKRFTQSGIYTFVIKDFYGNSYYQQYEFIRRIPTVSWKYEAAGQSFDYVEGQDGLMTIQENGTSRYNILTSCATVSFSFSNDAGYLYEFQVEDDEDDPKFFPNESFGMFDTTVKVTSLISWTVKVWYQAYPEIYAYFTYVLDDIPPYINVSYLLKDFTQNEDKEMNAAIESSVEGQILSAHSILYSVDNEMARSIVSGSIISADFLDVSFEDASGVSEVRVLLNGELFTLLKATPEEPITTLTLTRSGQYEIIATDKLQNAATFKVNNINNNGTEYYVDGKKVELVDNQLDYVKVRDGIQYYDKVDYGNESQLLKVPFSGTETYIAYLISLSSGEQQLIIFNSDGENLYQVQYVISVNPDNGQLQKDIKSAAVLNGLEAIPNRWYQISSALQLNFYALLDDSNNLSLRVLPKEDGTVCTIETKIIINRDIEPAYVKTVLSTFKSDVQILNEDDEVVKTNKNEVVVCLNKSFYIDEEMIPADVVEIRFAYSKITSFVDMNIVYDGTTLTQIDTTLDGFYLIEIINIYGNTTMYKFNKSTVCMVIITTSFADGTSESYSNEYDKTVYSNKSVLIEVYSQTVDYELTRFNEDSLYYEVVKPDTSISEEGYYIIGCSTEGSYRVTVRDEYGNILIRTFEIYAIPLVLDPEILYGFNEKALRISENYTNLKLSIDATKFTEVRFVSVISPNGSEKVLYNEISEEKIISTNDELKEVIGLDGTGIYTVVFKDAYGNRAVKNVRYREESTLQISRLTRNSGAEEEYALSVMEERGVWSNGSVKITTQASKAKVIVDGVEAAFPVSLSFVTDVRVGSIDHQVEYVDEYGFYYIFMVYLLRQDLKLELSPDIETKIIDDISTTRNNIVIVGDDDTTITYTLNGGEPIEYLDSKILRQDGIYRFTEVDFAGNVAILQVKKDNMVEYRFYNESNENLLTSGTVVNDMTVVFQVLNGDSTYIKKVFKDGEVYPETDYTRYKEQGKWEFILSDEIGNESYFCFYILNHRVNKFEYTTPYYFLITQVWFDDGSDTRVSYIHFVQQHDEYSYVNYTDDGKYEISMKSSVTGEIITFNVIVDTTAPPAKLVGCENGETTVETITLSGLEEGDIVYVYKDGKLNKTYDIVSSADGPEISDGGRYRIVIVNNAGNVTEYEFTRTHIANTAGSVLIIILALSMAVGFFVGIILRNKSKVDK